MIHLRITGTGPPVLLLHGSPSPAEDFRPLVERLSRRHRFIWPDLPGYGLTPPVEAKTSVPRVQVVVEDALLAMGVSELAVVGHSFGAYRGFSLALGGRIKVTDLVCLGGYCRVDDADRPVIQSTVEALRKLTDFKDEAFRRSFAERMLAPDSAKDHPELLEQVGKWLDLTSPGALADETESMLEARDLLPHVGTLKTRVTMRVGAQDAVAKPRYAEEIAIRMRSAQVQVVPGAGHALLAEDPFRTLEALDDALRVQVTPRRERED